MRKPVGMLLAAMLAVGVFGVSSAHSSKVFAAGTCTSGWSNFNTQDGNLIDTNTNTAAVIQIQYDSQGQWCGLERAMWVLRIGAGDPAQQLSGDFYDYANGQNQPATSSTAIGPGWEYGSLYHDTYYTIYSPSWTWQYCVQVDTFTGNPLHPASGAFGSISCL